LSGVIVTSDQTGTGDGAGCITIVTSIPARRSACDPSHPLTSLESLQAKYRMTKRHICKHTEIHNVEQKEKERTTEIIGQLFTAEVKDK